MMLAQVLVVVVAAASSALCQETEFAYPDTAPGRQMKALVEAHNTGTDEAYRNFSENHRSERSKEQAPTEQIVQAMGQIRTAVGEMTPHSIRSQSPLELVVLVQFGDGGAWGELRVVCEDPDPGLVLSFTVVPTEGPDSGPTEFKEWTDLEDLVEQAREMARTPAIAVAIVAGDEIVAAAASGTRARGVDATVTVQDRFHVGSVTKAMTGTVIGALVESGDLDWDMALDELFDEVHDDYAGVTLAELVCHRGGVPAYTSVGNEQMQHLRGLPGNPTEQRAAFVAELLAQAPESEPGSRMEYSNAGYSILAAAAEVVTERSWEELIEEYVFEASGMEHAGFGWPATPERPKQPRGHTPGGPQKLDDSYVLPAALAPSGDVHCSIEDLAGFARMHLRGLNGVDDVLAADTVQELHVDRFDDDYGSGWVLRGRRAPCHWHNGSAGTFYALAALFPERGRAVVVLMNAATPNGESVAWELIEAIEDRKLGAPDRP